jgi:hypothetical protein
MKELIVIQGAGQAEVEQLLKQVAQGLDPEASITSLQLFATRCADTFAVSPSRLCEGWDFSDLCLHLKAALADHSGITAQAWLQLPSDTMNSLPAHQMLCIGFDRPSPDELSITDPDGTCYEFILYTDEESGEEFVQAEPAGTGDYHPRPKLQLQPLCHIAVGERRPFKRLRRLYEKMWESDSEWIVGLVSILSIVAFFALIIVAILGAWDFSETVLPLSIPDRAPFICFPAVGLVLALLNVTFKKWNFWGRFVYSTIATAVVTGLLMVVVFSTNRLIPAADPVVGQGVVTRHIENKGSNNYYIDVTAPVKGTIYFRMHGDGTLRIGDTVSLTLRRGIFGMYHTRSVKGANS